MPSIILYLREVLFFCVRIKIILLGRLSASAVFLFFVPKFGVSTSQYRTVPRYLTLHAVVVVYLCVILNVILKS